MSSFADIAAKSVTGNLTRKSTDATFFKGNRT